MASNPNRKTEKSGQNFAFALLDWQTAILSLYLSLFSDSFALTLLDPTTGSMLQVVGLSKVSAKSGGQNFKRANVEND